MQPTTLGTAAVANLFLAFSALSVPTVSSIPRLQEPQVRHVDRVSTRSTELAPGIVIAPSVTAADIGSIGNGSPTRTTTSCEELIGEIRSWSLLETNWDGEGALAPSPESLKQAVSFVRLLSDIPLPEPMLLSSGRAALYWNENNLYADLEFLEDGRIAYFIKNNGDKHKGVLAFNSEEMPAVFPALIKA